MVLDIILGLVFFFGFMYGYSRGIIKTIIFAVGIFVALVAALKLSPLFIDLIEKLLPNTPQLSYVVGFLATFLIVFLVFFMFGRFLEKIFKTLKINFFNKFFGGSITAILAVILFSFVLSFLNSARLISENQKDRSFSYYTVEPISRRAIENFNEVKPFFQEFIDKTNEVFNKIHDEGQRIKDEQGVIEH